MCRCVSQGSVKQSVNQDVVDNNQKVVEPSWTDDVCDYIKSLQERVRFLELQLEHVLKDEQNDGK